MPITSELVISSLTPARMSVGGFMSPYMSHAVRFATYLSLLPKPTEVLSSLTRDYLRNYGIKSVQLFALHTNNQLELKAEAGQPSVFSVLHDSAHELEVLEEIISTENVCREIALAGCIHDPRNSLIVTPFSVSTNLLGFFVFEVDSSLEPTKTAKEAYVLFSSLTSLYLTQNKNLGFIQSSKSIASECDFKLSARQAQILQGMVEGKTNHELATDLGFSVSTIRHETMAIFKALGVSDRIEAAQIVQLMELI